MSAVPGWPQMPEEAGFIEAVGVAISSRDEVFVFARAEIPILMFDREGRYLRGWGQGQFVRPHGIWIGPDDDLYLTDDKGHSVRRFSLAGELIQSIGPGGEPADSGIEDMDYRTIQPGVGPYNMPTNLVTGPQGDLFITDGYGNARVHRFSAAGELEVSWGEPGDSPGQFNVPHGIAADADGRLYVCDRENSRIQLFSSDGELLAIWDDVARPCQAYVTGDLVYVAELGFHAGVFPWNTLDRSRTGGRVSVFDRAGKLLHRWGGGRDPASPEDFYSPHDIQVDSEGSVYVAEVKVSAARPSGADSSGFPSLRKFEPVL
ncbi:MAG TPA: peptidyl-alpha-hydroxyglycine alpha-amidating lyase family protein [Candidatus Latescibacteria bacterium]|nr:peptidyl-alpha-hydroxyglycine alpha-amidating lyase family protein [Candidatus Latescibacterota bacterium]HJP30664.1 peptidyl-alpha-hydroxyglycine alpha-amidating lyase family protein [Candidatus Latescibacterota bacterium]